MPLDFLAVAVVVSDFIPAPFLVAMCVLEEAVVVLVSVLFAQEARKATPTRAIMVEISDFFIGW